MNKMILARCIAALVSVLRLPNKVDVRKASHSTHPFFIISAGRSGSTLLNRILNENQHIFLPSEQYFLGVAILKFRMFRMLLWRDLVKIILGELVYHKSHTWDIRYEPLFEQLFSVDKHHRSLRLIIDSIYNEYGSQQGKTEFRWGDSTPLNSLYVNELLYLYPKASFIFLVRDGREVCASYKIGGKEAFGKLSDPVQAANHWNKSIKALDYLIKKKCKVYILKYEDLQREPEKSINSLTDYLGVSYNNGMLSYYDNIPDTLFFNESQHQKLKLPVISEPSDGWRKAFTTEEKNTLLPILNPGLERFGYI